MIESVAVPHEYSFFFLCNQIDFICYHGHIPCPIDSECRELHPVWEEMKCGKDKRWGEGMFEGRC